jgi:hypothetical protein
VATATAAKVVLTPANFYHFRRPKFNFQPLSFTFESFSNKLAIFIAGATVKEIKEKNRKKALKSLAMTRQQFFTKIQILNHHWGENF